jgi:uncharacterized repeat protein (TIGR03803 family)
LGNSSSGSGAASLRRVKKTENPQGPDFAAILQHAHFPLRSFLFATLSAFHTCGELFMKNNWFTGLALAWALGATVHAQTYKVMDYFNVTPSSPVYPGVIAQSRGGNLVTTTSDQSSDLRGVAYRVGTSGALTVLHQFGSSGGDSPGGGLTLARDGLFYGTNAFGGSSNGGTVFQMTADGVITTLHEFDRGVDGVPYAPPVQSFYGDFYGTTHGNQIGGRGSEDVDAGTVYKIDNVGNYTLLHTFTGPDGANPAAPLVQSAANYWFYGTTESGGPSNVGIIFRVDSKGDFEVIHNFGFGDDVGYDPSVLIQATDGNFYGVNSFGGPHGGGVIFKMTPTNQLSAIYTFTGGTDGAEPGGALVQGSDGYLYGTTERGGGNLFRISTTGARFTVLHNFHLASGTSPVGFIQHTNGFFYGDTNSGGMWNGTFQPGVFYRLDMGLPPFVTYLNTYGRVGMTVDLLGDGFTTDSRVSFNGVAATETSDVQNSFMKVVIPEGATTGPITVTTTKGTLTSNKLFVVRP